MTMIITLKDFGGKIGVPSSKLKDVVSFTRFLSDDNTVMIQLDTELTMDYLSKRSNKGNIPDTGKALAMDFLNEIKEAISLRVSKTEAQTEIETKIETEIEMEAETETKTETEIETEALIVGEAMPQLLHITSPYDNIERRSEKQVLNDESYFRLLNYKDSPNHNPISPIETSPSIDDMNTDNQNPPVVPPAPPAPDDLNPPVVAPAPPAPDDLNPPAVPPVPDNLNVMNTNTKKQHWSLYLLEAFALFALLSASTFISAQDALRFRPDMSWFNRNAMILVLELVGLMVLYYNAKSGNGESEAKVLRLYTIMWILPCNLQYWIDGIDFNVFNSNPRFVVEGFLFAVLASGVFSFGHYYVSKIVSSWFK